MFLMNIFACNNTANSENTEEEVSTKTEIIEVYYFHYSRRCATCVAVEEETQRILKELYPEKMENNEITFLSVDMDEKEGKELAKKMRVSGQSLLFIQGYKQINLTSDAFLYANSNPDKLKEKIEKTILKML